MSDIESMFYRVNVQERHRDYFRFLWWPNGDFSNELTEYQMCVHLFGATSSPSCANYALHQTASDYVEKFGQEAADILTHNFYVDDMLKSFINSQTAITVVPQVVGMSKSGGFRLTKFHSNNREVLAIIPEEDKSKHLKNLDMSSNPIPEERALGMNWNPETDKFRFKIKLKTKPQVNKT